MTRHVPTYQLYGENPERTGRFWLHCESIPERSRLHDWEIRPHRHEAFFQILYISHGQGEALMDGAYRPFSRETAMFVPPGAVHGFRFSRDIGGQVLTVLRDRLDSVAAVDRHAAAFFAAPRILPLVGQAGRDAGEDLVRLGAEIQGRGAGRAAMLEALVVASLVGMVRAADGRDAEGDLPRDRDQERIERLGALIGAHFREHRDAAFYAGAIGVSTAHLNRILRAATGCSLQQLLNRRLVEEARRDLVFTFLPAQSIALALGFSDPAYFSRFFRRETGMTPGEYRKAERAALRF
ncbi:MAG TPA: helix-turn-helix domain-containing protein [Rhizobiales bacterium]|nr:helix-turn-helix domain-containing protein [Hyphomicrobiales bacterium]